MEPDMIRTSINIILNCLDFVPSSVQLGLDLTTEEILKASCEKKVEVGMRERERLTSRSILRRFSAPFLIRISTCRASRSFSSWKGVI